MSKSSKTPKNKLSQDIGHEPPDIPIAADELSNTGDVVSPPDDGILPEGGPIAEMKESEHGGVSDVTSGEGDRTGEEAPEEIVGNVPRLADVLEAILFASQKAVSPKELVAHLKNAASAAPASSAVAFARIKEGEVREALEQLRGEVDASGRAYQVRETATGWLLCTAPLFAPWLRALYPETKPHRLSAPALETLAIIAYRQPITRADIEAVRGVAVDGVMQTILDRGLIRIAGRSETPGRPLLYSTTQYFLDHFGLRNLDELPNAAELRHVPLPKSEPEPASTMPPENSAEELVNTTESGQPALLGIAEENSANSSPLVDGADSIEASESFTSVDETIIHIDPDGASSGHPDHS